MSLAVLTVGIVAPARRAPHAARQVALGVSEPGPAWMREPASGMPAPERKPARAGPGRGGQPEPSAANHAIRWTLFHPVASEADG
jgi:hypothetical protein